MICTKMCSLTSQNSKTSIFWGNYLGNRRRIKKGLGYIAGKQLNYAFHFFNIYSVREMAAVEGRESGVWSWCHVDKFIYDFCG